VIQTLKTGDPGYEQAVQELQKTREQERNPKKANMRLQLKVLEMRVLACHAQIMAGLLTHSEREKCERSVGAINNHVKLAQEILDNLMEEVK
jgi:hypothetical protein